MIIDTHAHVEFTAYKDDANEVMQRALDSDVAVINVGTQIDTSKNVVAMLEKFSENVWAVVGLHPEHTYKHQVVEETDTFLTREESFDYDAYKALANNPRVVGIGECGLDYYRFEDQSDVESIKKRQREAFELQIKLAFELDKALVIHCRPSSGTVDAYEDILEIVKPYLSRHSERSEESQNRSFAEAQDDKRLRFEVHCFTGTLEVAQKFAELGGYLGLNGIITFDKSGNSENIVKNIPLENIILETDCPYLTPAPHRGKRNEPSYIKYTAEKIAEWKNISFDEVASQTTKNAKSLFKI